MRHASNISGWTAALLLLCTWSIILIVRYWGMPAVDMEPVYLAARFVWLGEPGLIYGGPGQGFTRGVSPEWQAELALFGVSSGGAQFVYPPIWAYVLSPLAGVLDPISFFNGARVLVVASFSASILLTYHIMRPSWPPALFVSVAIIVAETTMPFLMAIELGQLHLVVIAAVLFAFERYAKGKDTAAGLALGLAAAIKITPIIFVVIFLADRRFRAMIVAAAVPVIVACMSIVVAGGEAHGVFLDRIGQIEALVPVAGLNLTFETVAHDFFVALPHCHECLDPRVGRNVALVATIGAVLLPVSLGAILWITRKMPDDTRMCTRLLPVSVVIIFFGPLGWMHYYVMPVLLFQGLAPNVHRRLGIPAGAMAWIGVSVLAIGAALEGQPVVVASDFYPQHIALLSITATIVIFVAVVCRSRSASDLTLRVKAT